MMGQQAPVQSPPDDSSGEKQFHKSPIGRLDDSHRFAVTQGIANVLSTEVAEATFAQIQDGLPLAEVVEDVYSDLMLPDHPISQNTRLSPHSLEKFRAFRDSLDFLLLSFDSSLLHAFQAALPGSSAFHTRLIEIVAVAIHQVAVLLYKSNPDLAHGSSSAVHEIHIWEPPKDPDSHWNTWWDFHPHGPPVTLFHHAWYTGHAHYPDGAADLAGYWAESRIFGGVVLFDRSGSDPGAVYLHPDRNEVTYRISKLTEEQTSAFLCFLVTRRAQREEPKAGHSEEHECEDLGGRCPLPILPDETNLHRVDPEEHISVTGVYRDVWEREMPPPEWMGDGRASDVRNPIDFPTKASQGEAYLRWIRRG